MTYSERAGMHYHIRIRGHLDPSWSDWLDDLVITQEADGTTALIGAVPDESALFGLLTRLRDLGATLLRVEHVVSEEPPTSATAFPGADGSER